MSAGVGSRGSGPAKVLLLFRYNSIAAAARPRPSPRPRLGRASPNGASRSPGATRHEPPHRPSCEAIACAAMTRRKWRCASFPPSSGSGIADAASTNRSLNSRATRAFVRTIASQYGRRSLAQLVQCPKSAQYDIIASPSFDSSSPSCAARHANSASRRYAPRPTVGAPPSASAAARTCADTVRPRSIACALSGRPSPMDTRPSSSATVSSSLRKPSEETFATPAPPTECERTNILVPPAGTCGLCAAAALVVGIAMSSTWDIAAQSSGAWVNTARQ